MGLGVDVDAQQAAPATLEVPRCILDDLASAEAAQPGGLQVEHDDRRAGRERVEQRPQPAGVAAPEGSSGPDRGRDPRRLRYRRGWPAVRQKLRAAQCQDGTHGDLLQADRRGRPLF
jgi:hypothetical protein